jgi:cytochrome c oxidase cbb3-type subunit 3
VSRAVRGPGRLLERLLWHDLRCRPVDLRWRVRRHQYGPDELWDLWKALCPGRVVRQWRVRELKEIAGRGRAAATASFRYARRHAAVMLNPRQFLLAGLVLGACVAGGALECHRPALSAEEAHGAELYGRMCAVCHGGSAEGYAADQAPAIGHPEFLGSASDEFLRDAIAHGRSDTTMSAWSLERGGPLAPPDVDALVAYLRTFRRDPPIPLDEAPLHGNTVSGHRLFQQECAKCHGERGKGGPNVGIGNPELLEQVSNGFLRHAIVGGRSGTAMPGFAESLGAERIEDLIALLRSYEKPPAPARPSEPAKAPPIPLGPVPLNPKGPEPIGFNPHPTTTKSDVVHTQLKRGAKMALLDARPPPQYTQEHISGAVSVPFYAPEPYFDKLPKDVWLVCYCSCPHAESRTLAQKLKDAGFRKVTVLDEGLGYWHTKKYGTTRGVEP